MNPPKVTKVETVDPAWRGLYTAGGVAALAAAVLFRRNFAAEIGLFSSRPAPTTVDGWFAHLQGNRLLALAELNVLDVVNYALLALMFLALYVALKQAGQSAMAIATVLGLLGSGVYLASNTALSMLALSGQYAAAATEAQRTTLLAAGQGLLALSRFGGPGSHPGSAGYVSLLLVAAAGLIAAVVMLRSAVFNRATAYVGIAAAALDLAYCLGYAFVPVDAELLALSFIPAAGLLWIIWHIMVGRKLCQLGLQAARRPRRA